MKGRPRQASPLLVLACAATVALAAAAAPAAAPPDAHDRALAATLAARVAVFRAIAARTRGGSSSARASCPSLKQNPGQALAAAFSILPVLLIEVVDELKPELTGLRATLAAMHPDAPLFARWLSDERDELDLILEFDNHGRPLDLCAAVTVLAAKHPASAEVERVLGIDPSLVTTLFATASRSSAQLSGLAAQMRAFFLAAGLSRASAVALTSSS